MGVELDAVLQNILEPMTGKQLAALVQHTARELTTVGGRVPFCWCRACEPRDLPVATWRLKRS